MHHPLRPTTPHCRVHTPALSKAIGFGTRRKLSTASRDGLLGTSRRDSSSSLSDVLRADAPENWEFCLRASVLRPPLLILPRGISQPSGATWAQARLKPPLHWPPA